MTAPDFQSEPVAHYSVEANVCEQVNKHVAHTANPEKSRNFVEWNMGMEHLEAAQKAICRAAIILDRDILQRQNIVEIIRIEQYDFMKDLRLWISDDVIQKFYKCWHDHRIRMLKESNKGGLQEMVRQGKLVWLDYGQEVSLESVDVSLGAKEVRIKGTTTTTT